MTSDGEKWVAVQNIMHFEDLLKSEADEKKRQILLDMIQRERTKLCSPDTKNR